MKLPTTPGSESRRRKIAAWAARMGPEYMETLARRGGDATKRKGKEYFATIGRKGGLATRRLARPASPKAPRLLVPRQRRPPAKTSSVVHV